MGKLAQFKIYFNISEDRIKRIERIYDISKDGKLKIRRIK